MFAFFQSQLDYIYFFYGLAFVFLGFLCFLLQRQYRTYISWRWLSAFGFLHGFNEWADMINLTVGSNVYWFQILRLFLLTTSFLCLIEFWRQNYNQHAKAKVGRWFYILIAVVLFWGWQIDREAGFGVFVRCVLGVGGSIAAGMALWKFSSLYQDQKIRYCMGATAFWIYALSQLILPTGELFGLHFTNQAFFFETFGFPIQFIRGLLAITISVCFWLHYEKVILKDLKKQQVIRDVGISRQLFGVLLGIFIFGWLFCVSLGKYALIEEKQLNLNTVEVLGANVEKVLDEGKDLSKILAGSPLVLDFFKIHDAQSINNLNILLDRYRTASNVSISYILDKNGTTLATSNRNAPDSLLGKNYSFRPYFKNAIAGSPAVLFAVGVTTKKAGFYASYPIMGDQNEVMGVAVIKMDLSQAEDNIKQFNPTFLVSPEGIIFLSSDPAYYLHTVEPITYLQKRQFLNSQQYDRSNFDNVFKKKPQNGDIIDWEDGSYLVSTKGVDGDGWSIVFLKSTRMIGLYRLFGIVITFIFYILTIGFVTMYQDIRRSAALAYLASMIFSSDDAIIGKDFSGKINSWNKGAEKIYGYYKDEVLGKSINILIPKDRILENNRILEKISSGKSVERYETAHLKKNGQLIFVSLTISPVRDNMGAIVGASMISRDITKQKIAEEMIEHSEKKFTSLFNNISDMVFISDLDGKLLDFNQTMVTILGYTKNELYKMSRQDFNTPEFAILVPERLKQIIKTGVQKFEGAFVTKKGNIIPVDVRSNIFEYEGKTAILNSARDISAAKLADDNLKQQMVELEKFKLAVDGSSDSIMITDKDAHVLYVNKAILDMTGFTKEEIIGKYIGNLWGGHMEKGYYENMWHTIKDAKQIFTGELNNRRKNGEEYIVSAKFYPILDKNGEISFFVGVESDITKAKQLEHSKSEFVSVASHQLRTPLTGIKWFSELLLKGQAGTLTVNQNDYIQQIFTSNDRMIKLVDDLLDVSHMDETGHFKIVLQSEEFSEIIKEVVNEQQLIADNKKIKIKVEDACLKRIKLKVDKSKISQAIQNILNNAVKYSPSGSVIKFDCKKDSDNFIYSISDQGVGIPDNQHSRIFEKFFRGDNVISTGSGTGLGLYISKYIINAHAGKIWFESKEGKGTTFYISLPIKQKL